MIARTVRQNSTHNLTYDVEMVDLKIQVQFGDKDAEII